ncbi:flagellar assembly protein FliH [Pseudobacillus wudalianchiensis]|uniref:Flagellar assembly protein FliH n=1 Tax=Pseudobacillus wudalianchiensis TaxID=1743143 RepID=A0A1B9AJ50_9BACI|nr:flagellar assembly protein FliH [Bacillus wudalianchiensis]OCA83837.1 flagellar assembly protein FliH [Bacillus wudalianchiensis]
MSRIIKSHRAERTSEANKEIKVKVFHSPPPDSDQGEGLSNQTVYFEEDKKRILEEAEAATRDMIAQAEQQRREIEQAIESEKQSWEAEKQALVEQAYEEGFQAGQAQGRKAGYDDYIELIETAKEAVECSKKEYEMNVQRSEKLILDIAIKSAERITSQKLQEDEQAFLTMIKQALKDMPDQKEIQIHVHPAHYSFVVSQKEEIDAMFPIDTLCYIYPNEKLEEDGCYIETSHGRIEIGLDSQLQQLRKQLFELLEGEEH